MGPIVPRVSDLTHFGDRVSEHFTWGEVAKTDRREFQAVNRLALLAIPKAQAAAVALSEIIEAVRTQFGATFVHSWYRSPTLNIAVGGQEKSQHMRAEAVDFETDGRGDPAGLTEVFNWIRRDSGLFVQDSPDSRVGQVIIEGDPYSWIHISLGAGWRAPDRCGEALYTTRKASGRGFDYHPLALAEEPPL